MKSSRASTGEPKVGFPDLESAHELLRPALSAMTVPPHRVVFWGSAVGLTCFPLLTRSQDELQPWWDASQMDRRQWQRAACIPSPSLFPAQPPMGTLGSRGTWGRWSDQGQRLNRDGLTSPVPHPGPAQAAPGNIVPADGFCPQSGGDGREQGNAAPASAHAPSPLPDFRSGSSTTTVRNTLHSPSPPQRR
jgi:hypothetical protein